MDLPALLLGTLQATIVLGSVFVLPGLVLGPLVAPGAATPLDRLGRAAGVSLLTVAPACMVLAWIGWLTPAAVVVALATLIVLPLIVRRPRSPLRRPTGHAARWWIGAFIGTVAVAILTILPSRAMVGSALLPFTSTVWYYANLAVATGAARGFPPTLPEWGTERPFQTDYLPVTAHTAGFLELMPGDLLVNLELYRLALVIAGILVGTLLLRRWVSTWLAVLGACLLLGTARLEFKFLAYKPETFGLILALFGLWLLDRALIERSRRLAILAMLTAAVVFLSHAEVFLVFASGAVGLATARWLVAPGGGPLGLRLPLDKRLAATSATVAAVLLGGMLLGAIANAVVTGDARLAGYVFGRGASASAPAAPRRASVPDGWVQSGDPTWDFYVAAVAWNQLGDPPPTSFVDRRLLQRSTLQVWPGLDARSPSMLIVLVAVVGLPLLAWPWLGARRRRMVLTWWVFAVVLFVGSYVLFTMSDTYVPRRVGPRRLIPYELLLPVVSAVIVLWGVDRLVRPGWLALLPRRGAAMLAAGAFLAVLTAGMLAPAPSTPSDEPDREPGLTSVGYEAYRWIAANTPTDARVLANAYTDGSLAAISGRTGIVDGRAVYLEDPTFLADSTDLLLGARVAFADPDGAAAADFLASEGVDYVLVAGPEAQGSDLGGYRPFETDHESLADSGRYTLVRTFGDGRLSLYRVDTAA
jgi:hypothetical protein